MINTYEILETIKMISSESLDIRTITMGISLRDCAHSDMDELAKRVYDKITRKAEKLVKTGEDIEREYGIPITNKRISVTPVSIIGEAANGDYIKIA
ncbi:MAG TPA: PFL family protein, partial [Dehalococcoidia bacterium]|nr:PFL family protein [Dehalococcoidia bacterium]